MAGPIKDVTAAVNAREDERRAALVADDMAALAELLADDLVHVHTTGIVNTKAQLLAHAGGFLRFYEVERGTLTVRPLGDAAAVMTGTMINTVGKRGTDERVKVQAFVTQLWERHADTWRLASFHATRTQSPSQE